VSQYTKFVILDTTLCAYYLALYFLFFENKLH